MPDDGPVATFASATRSFAGLVRDIHGDRLIAVIGGLGGAVVVDGRTALPPSFSVV